MAGQSDGRSLERTPTWAVAVVCFVLVSISIFIEHIILLIGKWLNKRQKRSLYGAFEKVKSELMLLGFISLLLTVGQDPISNICIPKSVGDTWHPCRKKQDANSTTNYQLQLEKKSRKLLATVSNFDGSFRRVLAAAGTDKCAAKNEVALVSADGIHQLHIFIFVLAVFHVLNCILTLALGGAKMRSWKAWESETRTLEYQLTNDPERFRFTRQTSFGRRHLSFWTKNPLLIWIVCLFRQFVRSVPKVDYLTLRHGFIIAHLPPQSHENFDFQKYIKRSLEDDFKVVVGISPPLWLFAMLFLLFNTNGWNSHLWLPFIPLIIIVLVGAKLQVIITKMGLRIQERGDVVKGTPVVEPGDDLFWFKRPRIILHLINFVLFQNAFQLAFFAWTWYEFGVKSCFHEDLVEVILRISMGVLIQILCSYVTLPLYALVTQMGSRMKPVIFSDGVATALRKWHQTAKKRIKQNRSGSVTPISSPSRHTSPVHLLRHYNFFSDSLRTSQNNLSDTEGSLSPHHQHCLELGDGEESSSSHVHVETELTQQIDIGLQDFSFDKRKSTLRAVQHCVELGDVEESSSSHVHVAPQPETEQAQQVEINVGLQDFSFDKRKSTLRAVQD